VLETLSPRAIVTGLEIDFVKHCQLEFGTYVQTHEQSDNTMRTRTVGALAMRPTGNEQGGYYFFSLSTGRRLNRNRWTALPMPHEVIERVHFLARDTERGLLFGNRNNVPDDDNPFASDGESYATDDSDDEDDDSVAYDSADDDPIGILPTAGVDNQQDDSDEESESDDKDDESYDPEDNDESDNDTSDDDNNINDDENVVDNEPDPDFNDTAKTPDDNDNNDEQGVAEDTQHACWR
jgi:hypothetical protein